MGAASSGWLTELTEQAALFTGGEMSADELLQERPTPPAWTCRPTSRPWSGSVRGPRGRERVRHLTLFDSSDGSDLPIAAKVQGEPEKIKAVLAKLIEQDPDGETFLANDSDGDTIVIGPNADYRAKVLAPGALGDADVFRDVVREADRASAVFFVNFNVNDDWLASAVGEEDASVEENLKPLAGFGVTTWMDGDYAHSVLRLTTD